MLTGGATDVNICILPRQWPGIVPLSGTPLYLEPTNIMRRKWRNPGPRVVGKYPSMVAPRIAVLDVPDYESTRRDRAEAGRSQYRLAGAKGGSKPR